MHVVHPMNGMDYAMLMAASHGSKTSFDINATIIDIRKRDRYMRSRSASDSNDFSRILNIGNVVPGQIRLVENWNLSGESERLYNIFMVARNGSFTQTIRFLKLNGFWVLATKVVDKSNNTLFELVDDKFPRSDEGKPIWG